MDTKQMLSSLLRSRVPPHATFLSGLLHQRRISIVLRYIPSEGETLDVGCGNGRILRRIEGRAIGIDLSVDRLKEAKESTPSADTVLGDAQNLPFRSGVFRTVICSEVLEHLDQPQKTATEAKRTMEENGRIIVSFPHESNLEKMRILTLYFPIRNPKHRHRFTSNHLDAFFHPLRQTSSKKVFLPFFALYEVLVYQRRDSKELQ